MQINKNKIIRTTFHWNLYNLFENLTLIYSRPSISKSLGIITLSPHITLLIKLIEFIQYYQMIYCLNKYTYI